MLPAALDQVGKQSGWTLRLHPASLRVTGQARIEESVRELRRQQRCFVKRSLSLGRLVVVHCFRTCPHRAFDRGLRPSGRSLRVRDINRSETGHHGEADPYGAVAVSSHKSLTGEPLRNIEDGLSRPPGQSPETGLARFDSCGHGTASIPEHQKLMRPVICKLRGRSMVAVGTPNS